MSRGRRTLWVVAAVLLIGAVVALVAVTVLPQVAPRTGAGSATTSPSALRPTTSPALVGYPVLNGNQGYPVAVGRPWSTPCAPIALIAAPGAPAPFRALVRAVVAEAAAGGVPVLSAATATDGRPVRIVQVEADRYASPRLPDGRPQQVLWSFLTSYDAVSRTETIEAMSTLVYLKMADDEIAQKRALRSLLARTFGLDGSTRAGSGLAKDLGATVDRFTPSDLGALRAMSGCA